VRLILATVRAARLEAEGLCLTGAGRALARTAAYDGRRPFAATVQPPECHSVSERTVV